VWHGYDADVMRDPPPDDHPLAREPERYAFRVVGPADGLEGALRVLWVALRRASVELGAPPSALAPEDRRAEGLAAWLEESPVVAYEDEEAAADDWFFGQAAAKYPESRFAAAVYGAAPYEGEAACVLELAEAGEPAGVDAALFEACDAGDVGRASAALDAGADVDALDRGGHRPLHHAAARRDLALTAALVDAGADVRPRGLASSPLFAARREGDGALGPFAECIDGEEHFRILQHLIERGAGATTKRRDGTHLADLAAAELPFDEGHARWLVARGRSSRSLRAGGLSRADVTGAGAQ
jgi:hypothetical protein